MLLNKIYEEIIKNLWTIETLQKPSNCIEIRLLIPFIEVTKEHNQEYNYWNKQKLIMKFLLLFTLHALDKWVEMQEDADIVIKAFNQAEGLLYFNTFL